MFACHMLAQHVVLLAEAQPFRGILGGIHKLHWPRTSISWTKKLPQRTATLQPAQLTGTN